MTITKMREDVALGCGAGVGKYRSATTSKAPAIDVQCNQHNNTDPDDERRERYEILVEPVSPILV